MGLDMVDMVLRIEETFGIVIPDTEASQIVAIGDLHQSILQRLHENRSSKCLTARAFYRLRQGLVSETGVDRSAVRPDAPLNEVVPASLRRHLWPRLAARLALTLPSLCRPPRLTAALTLAIVAWIGLGHFAMWTCHIPWPLWFHGISVAAIFVAVVATRPFATEVRGCRTVGDVAKAILRDNFAAISAELKTVNEREALESLLGLISDQLGVSRTELHLETRFVKDLGVD